MEGSSMFDKYGNVRVQDPPTRQDVLALQDRVVALMERVAALERRGVR